MKLSLITEEKLKEIAGQWDWGNLDSNWTILEGAYCRLSWVEDGLPKNEEYRDILKDTMELIEALQKEIKIKVTI